MTGYVAARNEKLVSFKMSDKDKKPNPIDVSVGNNVRLRRTELGFSQEKLGEHLGISFQQVQKYERGTNRISVSKLKEISDFLKISISDLYNGVESATGFAEEGNPGLVGDRIINPELAELSRAFSKIDDPKVRKKILDLVKTLSDDIK